MAGEPSLRELKEEREVLENKIRLLEKEDNIKKGLVVASVDDLKCDRHPNSKFEKYGIVSLDYFSVLKESREKDETLWNYVCTECKEENERPIPRAYDCYNCGIVIGVPNERSFGGITPLGPLKSNKGYKKYCKLCGTFLDSHTQVHVD